MGWDIHLHQNGGYAQTLPATLGALRVGWKDLRRPGYLSATSFLACFSSLSQLQVVLLSLGHEMGHPSVQAS